MSSTLLMRRAIPLSVCVKVINSLLPFTSDAPVMSLSVDRRTMESASALSPIAENHVMLWQVSAFLTALFWMP